MPKKIIKRYLPSYHDIRNYKSLQMFGSLLHDPNLWHLNRRSVSGACFLGLFLAFMPIPFQMVLAAAGAILFHVNLPIAVILVWISNPLTIPAIFYLSYKVGSMILDSPVQEIHFELSVNWLVVQLSQIWQPFLLGCLVLALIFATMGYVAAQRLWRYRVLRQWRKRLKRQQTSD